MGWARETIIGRLVENYGLANRRKAETKVTDRAGHRSRPRYLGVPQVFLEVTIEQAVSSATPSLTKCLATCRDIGVELLHLPLGSCAP